MKKIVILLVAILIAVWIAMTVISPSGDYDAEKLLYKAARASQKIAVNPDVVPPVASESIEKTLKTVIARYPAAAAAQIAKMKLAEFYAFMKKYDKSIEILDAIIYSPGVSPMLLSQALFLKGNTYEMMDQWAKALAIYKTLRDRCEETPIGLRVPLYIAAHYSKKSMSDEAAGAYNEAALFYAKVSKQRRGTIAGYWATVYLLNAYVNIKKYEEAGSVVEDMIATYPSNQTYMQNLPVVEFIFIKQLKQPGRALQIFKNVKEKAKDPRLISVLDKKISELEKIPVK